MQKIEQNDKFEQRSLQGGDNSQLQAEAARMDNAERRLAFEKMAPQSTRNSEADAMLAGFQLDEKPQSQTKGAVVDFAALMRSFDRSGKVNGDMANALRGMMGSNAAERAISEARTASASVPIDSNDTEEDRNNVFPEVRQAA